MTKLVLNNINKIYPNGVHAIKNFNLTISDKEFIVLVGPSGSGKSTLLRIIAGLEDITNGELYINEKLSNYIYPKDRNTSMVFQNPILFPHMTIAKNIAFGLKVKEIEKNIINHQIIEIARLLEIENLLDRKPNEISGGQRQRANIARALITHPDLFLLDEPLSSLDAKLRTQLRLVIFRLYEKLNIPFIYVTHDQVEAMTLATKIVVLKDGEIQQIASPLDIYHHPANQFVANFFGSSPMNFIKAKVNVNEEIGKLTLDNNVTLVISKDYKDVLKQKNYHNKIITLGIRPEHLIISEVHDYHIKGVVQFTETLGDQSYVYLDHMICVKTQQSISNHETLYLKINLDNIHLFDSETTLSILK